jgi:hypothetical protein
MNFNKLLILVFICFSATTMAQQKNIQGTIIDNHTNLPIAFASVFFKKANIGIKSDTNGNFTLAYSTFAEDSLIIGYVGYKKLYIPIASLLVDSNMVFDLIRGTAINNVVVKSNLSRGLMMWKQIMKTKDAHNRYKYNNFSYEAYNKLEVDIKNFKLETFKKSKMLNAFDFVFDNVDSTSEKEVFLPVYIVESISEFNYQNKPKKFYEKIKASNTKGIKNESISKVLGVTDQVININNNYIPIMDKDFISPLHDNANLYYTFRVGDTATISGKPHYLFTFVPKRPGQYTFNGEAWVESGTNNIKKITLYIDAEVNINYLSRVTINQEYQILVDSTYFVKKDELFADFNLVGKKKLTLIGRKSSSYKNIIVNNQIITDKFLGQKTEKLIIVDSALNNLSNIAWDSLRYEPLTKNEANLYKSIDKLLELPKFKKLQNTLTFIGTGYKGIGKFEIGPWYNWLSNNVWEGTRVRFDLGTTSKFNKNIYLHSYLAYGFKDKQFKGQAEAYWILKRKPNRLRLHASFAQDIDNGVSAYGDVGQDNFFTFAVRKPNISRKFLHVRDARFEIFKEWGSGLSTEGFVMHRSYNTLLNLPKTEAFTNASGEALQNFEVALKIRFAYMEQFLEANYFRVSIGSKYPGIELTVAKGISGVLGSSYNYTKVSGYIADYVKVSPLGSFSYKVFGGAIKGTLPFTFLAIHPGNDIYYYDKFAFNLMTRFEYIGDKYAGIMLEHNIGPGIFRFTPITRKLKWRQFYSFKAINSSLTAANTTLNNAGGNFFNTLNGKAYAEVGTGIDNIFKVLRFDAVWRIAPTPLPLKQVSRFGFFGSFQFQF